MELESLRSKNKFTFHFKISPDIDIFNIEIPSMLFQPYVENAITHGLLNQEKKGILTLSFSVEDSYLIGIIEDNGIGRKKSAELKSDVYKVHTSRGMEITQERITVLNFIENIEITVDVIDKLNTENEPDGTKVIIKIPI
jgi:sensor histidine kinase YesM